ncbi:MAG: hypothetical protein AAFO73_01470, partial [Pseudomonadota bacterium]
IALRFLETLLRGLSRKKNDASLTSAERQTALVRSGVAIGRVQTAPRKAKPKAAKVKYTPPVFKAKLDLAGRKAVRYVTGFEVSKLATWPSPKKEPGQLQRIGRDQFVTLRRGAQRIVPVYKIRGSVLMVPTQRFGMRWIKKIDVNLSPIDCKSKSLRVGGAGRGAVASGVGGASVVCGA